MKRIRNVTAISFISLTAAAGAQSFGGPLMKAKTTLQRKLPALVQLPGTSVTLVVTGHSDSAELVTDFKSMLGSELLKDDPRLSLEDRGADSTITCQITSFEHPHPTTSTRPGIQTGKKPVPPVSYLRVTGLMRVSFQARSRSGGTVGSDNVTAKYDEEFDASGNAASSGVTGAVKNTFKRIKGGKSEELNAPTDPELRAKLIDSAVKQIVMQVVNTRETVEVQLAKGKGLMDQGVKDAQAGLWTRALEEFSTMPPLPKPIDDAYRLYDVGVANEALGYGADDDKAAINFLDQASINYGKAIDSNPAEKYFREPQKRIETALAHYQKLENQKKTHGLPSATSTPARRKTK